MEQATLRLEVTNSLTQDASSWAITDGRVRVGCSTKNEVQLEHESVADEHAVFRIADGIWLTNLTSEGTTATSQGPMAIGDAVRVASGARVQIGAYVLECTLVVPTADFGMLLDASHLELPQLLVLPTTWRVGSVSIAGVPAALTLRTWWVLSRLAGRPREVLSPVELVAGLPIESEGLDVSRIVRTLRKQLATALQDQQAHERISMAINLPGDDLKATTSLLVESVRGKGYRLNLASGLVAFQ